MWEYMTPNLEYKYDIAYIEWSCICGNIEGVAQTTMSIKTTYTGGEASDRTVDSSSTIRINSFGR